MARPGSSFAALVLAAAVGAAGVLAWQRRGTPPAPDAPVVLSAVREVMRLETLDVTLYKKVIYNPEPRPGDGLWQDVLTSAKETLAPSQGKVIVFAEGHLGFDLGRLGDDSVAVDGDTVLIVLPPVQVAVELLPGETEVIGSNLSSAQT